MRSETNKYRTELSNEDGNKTDGRIRDGSDDYQRDPELKFGNVSIRDFKGQLEEGRSVSRL